MQASYPTALTQTTGIARITASSELISMTYLQ